MKIKNYLACLVIAVLCMANQQSVAQIIVDRNISVCGNSFKVISIQDPIKYTSYSMILPNSTVPYAYAPAIARNASTLQDAKLMFNTSNIPNGISIATILGYNSSNIGKVADNFITVDGYLSENWQLDKNVYFNAKSSPSNVSLYTSLYFNIKYDNNYVYFGGKVIDNTPGSPGDKVEIYIDPYNLDLINSPGDYLGSLPLTTDSTYIKAARQMVIPILSQGNTVFRKNGSSQFAYSWPDNGTRDTVGIKVAVRTFSGETLPNYDDNNSNPIELKGNCYYFEVAVPFANFFGLNPNQTIDVSTLDGYSFGFNIASNDESSDSQFFYNFNSDNGNSWNRTRPFGSATFSASDPQSASSFLGTVTITGIVLPAVDANISAVGDCQSELTISGIVTSVAGAESYWQTNENVTIGSDPLSNKKIFTIPFSQNQVFINTLFTNGCWSKSTAFEIKPTTLNVPDNKIFTTYPTCGIANFNASLVGISNRMYYWQTNNTITSNALTASNNYTISGSTLQTVYLRAQNTITGCWSDSLVTSATPNNTPPPPPDVTAGVDLLTSISGACVGKTAIVYYTKSVAGNNLWYWQTEPLGTSTGLGNDSLLASTTNTYYLRNQLFGCWSDRSVGISVDLSDVVVPSPSTKNYTYFQNEATIPLALTSANTLYGINWYVDSQTAAPVQVAPTPTSTEIGTKNYFVSYTNGNCESPKSPITVEIKELIVLIPKKYGITPNGSGPVENEKFEIDNISLFAGNKVTITDKWGNIVFEKENYDNSFDGKRDGKDLPFGSYLYIVNLNNGKTPLTGTLVITR